MGLPDLLSVVLGVRAADGWNEHSRQVREIHDQIAETRARIAYVESPAGQAEMRAKIEQESRRADHEMLMLWGRVDLSRRVRPDKRTGDEAVDAAAGAERGIRELDEDVGYLYTAALVGGSYRRWREALQMYEPKPGEEPSAEGQELLSQPAFHAYTVWVQEFRIEDAALLDELIGVGGRGLMTSSSIMKWSRKGLGLEA